MRGKASAYFAQAELDVEFFGHVTTESVVLYRFPRRTRASGAAGPDLSTGLSPRRKPAPNLAHVPSEWAAIESIAGKLGCTADTRRKWVRRGLLALVPLLLACLPGVERRARALP